MSTKYDIDLLVKTLTEIDRLAKDAELFVEVSMQGGIFFDFARATGSRIHNHRRRGPFFVWGNLRVEPTNVEYEYSKERFHD